NLAETLFLVQHTVRAAKRLQQSVILQVLIHIKRVELLAVKSGEEHTHYKAEVKRLHIRFLLFHAQVDVIVVGTEVFGSECSAEHFIVVVHNGLQFVRFTCAFTDISPRIHSCLLIVLATVGSVGEYSSDTDFRIQGLEYLVIADKHWHGLHSKQCVKLTVKG